MELLAFFILSSDEVQAGLNFLYAAASAIACWVFAFYYHPKALRALERAKGTESYNDVRATLFIVRAVSISMAASTVLAAVLIPLYSFRAINVLILPDAVREALVFTANIAKGVGAFAYFMHLYGPLHRMFKGRWIVAILLLMCILFAIGVIAPNVILAIHNLMR